MPRRTARLILAALMLSACAGGPTAGPRPEISRAYEDLEGAKPANLVRVSRNELVGRPIQGSGATPHTIHYVLADAGSREPRYVLTSGEGGTYVMIPMSLLSIGPGGIFTRASPGELQSLPHPSH